MPKRTDPKESPQSRTIKITPDEELYRQLSEWAKQEDRPLANLVVQIARRGVSLAVEEGRYTPSYPPTRTSQINVMDLQRLADQLQIPSDRLLKAIQEIKLEVVNGTRV